MTGMPEPSGDGRDAIVIRNDENDGRHPRAISDSDDRDAEPTSFKEALPLNLLKFTF